MASLLPLSSYFVGLPCHAGVFHSLLYAAVIELQPGGVVLRAPTQTC